MYAYEIWKFPNRDSSRTPKDTPFLWFQDTGDATIVGTMATVIDQVSRLSDSTLVTKVVIERVSK